MPETSDVVDQVQAVYDQVLAQAGEGVERLAAYAKDKPLAALGLALAVGLLVGHAKGRSGRSVVVVGGPKRR